MQPASTPPATNYRLRDEIKAYWSMRAATFDEQPGHEIVSEAERAAWQALILKHLGPGEGRAALDLACGTGVISHLMDDLGYAVTGLDFAEPMLDRARAKAGARRRDIAFRLADAETTMEPDGAYDVIVTRHLVWTLIDPAACFAEWRRVLKPGGRLMIVDGDFVGVSAGERLVNFVAAWIGRLSGGGAAPRRPTTFDETHRSILSRVHFAGGARAPDIAALLDRAGFVDIAIDEDLSRIHRAQARALGLFKGLARRLQHRYAVVAMRPR